MFGTERIHAGSVGASKARDLRSGLDVNEASGDAGGALLVARNDFAAGAPPRAGLAVRMNALDALHTHHRPLARRVQLADGLGLEPRHVVDQPLQIATERAVQLRGRLEGQRDVLVAFLRIEVEVGSANADGAAFPQAEIKDEAGHLFGSPYETGGHALQRLVDEVGGLRLGIEQPHAVRRAIVEELARLVVPLSPEERVEGATQVAVKQAEKLGPLLLVVRDVDVVVVDDLGRAVE